MKKVLYKIPDFIHRHFWKKAGISQDEKLGKKIRLFYPGTQTEIEAMVDEYRKKQIGIFLLFLLATIFLVFLMRIDKEQSETILIERNGFGEGSKEESLLLENGEIITFTVGEKEYTDDELEQAFFDQFKWIQENMLKDNRDMMEIRSDLDFMTELSGGFRAEWISEKPEILGHDGQVFNEEWLDEQQESVKVQLMLSYQDQVRTKELEFCVREPIHTLQEVLVLKIKSMIRKQEEESRKQDSFVIPGVIEGIVIKKPEGNTVYGAYLLVAALFGFCFFYQRSRMEDQGKERCRQLEEDYPVLIYKLVLYLGAGMNLRKTFQQITAEYEEDIHTSRSKKRYMYEELVVMVNEMGAGAGEQAFPARA